MHVEDMATSKHLIQSEVSHKHTVGFIIQFFFLHDVSAPLAYQYLKLVLIHPDVIFENFPYYIIVC